MFYLLGVFLRFDSRPGAAANPIERSFPNTPKSVGKVRPRRYTPSFASTTNNSDLSMLSDGRKDNQIFTMDMLVSRRNVRKLQNIKAPEDVKSIEDLRVRGKGMMVAVPNVPSP